MNANNNRFTEDEVLAVRVMREKGISTKEIARFLGRSPASIRQKCWHEKLTRGIKQIDEVSYSPSANDSFLESLRANHAPGEGELLIRRTSSVSLMPSAAGFQSSGAGSASEMCTEQGDKWLGAWR